MKSQNVDTKCRIITFLCFIMILILFAKTCDVDFRLRETEQELVDMKKHTHTMEYGEYGIIEDGISFPYARMPAIESDPEQ